MRPVFMNKKVYFNDNFLEFIDNATQVSQNQYIKKVVLESDFKPSLKNILKTFTNEKLSIQINIGNQHFTDILRELKKQFYYIEAAGGFIQKENEFLFIHRHGRWDLPKGKLEKEETTEHAAIRECEEECAVKNLKILKQLSSTFHIYPYKNGYALKQSYWYFMSTDYTKKLIPQLEESIDEVRWFGKEEIKKTILSDTYYTIRDVVNEALES